MQNPSESTTANHGRETIFDANNANTNRDLPGIIKQINELIKQDTENNIVVVWENANNDIGIISNRETLVFSRVLSTAIKRIKNEIFKMLEC